MAEQKEVQLECRDCEHQWTEKIELPMEVSAARTRMKGWGVCPKCGGKKVDILLSFFKFFKIYAY